MKLGEIYVSVDVEANGPIPGENSMWSLGAAAFDEEGTLLGTFSANLEDLPLAQEDRDTMMWWAERPEVWAEARKNARPPKEVMEDFRSWLTDLKGKIVLVAYPAGFDFTMIWWYYVKFTGFGGPVTFSCLDIKSFAMALMDTNYRGTTKRSILKKFPMEGGHTHVAVEDAIEQGKIFNLLLQERARRNSG